MPNFFLFSLFAFSNSRLSPIIVQIYSELLKNLRQRKVLFYLISCLKIDVINFSYAIKCSASGLRGKGGVTGVPITSNQYLRFLSLAHLNNGPEFCKLIIGWYPLCFFYFGGDSQSG